MTQTSEIPAAPRVQSFFGWLDASLQKRPALWMCILLAAGLVVRIWHASGTFLNPDEAMHFQAANQTSWWLAYRASLNLAHPPLLVLLLYVWRSFGTSELVLRMPSVLAGTAFCWLAYKWASTLFRPAVAWIVLVLTLFLPSTIDLSTEVRQYALMLAFAMASAYMFERSLETNSAPAMLSSSLSLWLALGFHYSAFLFAAAVGIYAVARMLARRPPLKIFALWEIGQIVALGLGYFFYVTQLSKLTHGDSSHLLYEWTSSYLPSSYFVPGKINPLVFVFARTGGVFQYTFGQLLVGDAAYLLFVAGIFLLLRKFAPGRVSPRQLALLLLLPFVVNCVAALAAAYPYGGARHSAFLIPFAVAGVGLALAQLLNFRLGLGISVAIALALLCNLFVSHRQPYISGPDQNIANMRNAMEFIHGQIAPEDPIFTDHQGSLMLRHYLCEQRPVTINLQVQGFRSYECGGHRVITPETAGTFIFTPSNFRDRWPALVSNYNLRSGSRVWVAQIGWNVRLAASLAALPEFHLAPHSFGQNIQMFSLTVGNLTVGHSMPDPKLLPTQ
jgi:hypothetical protein